jgi:hypothetical protein
MLPRFQTGLVLLTMLLYSCKTYVARFINVHVASKDTQVVYRNCDSTLIPPQLAVAHEGRNIKVTIDDYNPLSQTISINPVQGNYFYSSQSPLLSNFFPLTSAPANPTPDGTNVQVKQPNNVTHPSTKPDTLPCNNALCNDMDELQNFETQFKADYNQFRCFYNDLLYFDAQYEEYKLASTLDKACICEYLSKLSGELTGRINQINPPDAVPCPIIIPKNCDSTERPCGDDLIPSSILVSANTNFKQYFAAVADSLSRLQQKINTDLGAVGDFPAFFSKIANCATCANSLKNKAFLNFLSNDINWVQTLNTNYNTNLDKNISTAISAYTALRHAIYSTQQEVSVKDEDEFQLTIAIANSSTPATQTISMTLPVTKPVKIDFSAGGFYTSLYDEIGQLKKVTGQDSFFLKT